MRWLRKQKVTLVRNVEKGKKSKSVITQKFGIPASMLSTVMKNKQDVFDSLEKNFSSKRKRDQGSRYSKVEVVEDVPLEWLTNARGAGLTVHSPVLSTKTKDTSFVIRHD